MIIHDLDIPLRAEPSKDWGYRFARLLEDAWLARKIDRRRRLLEHKSYIDKFCPEIITIDKGLVIDIGPGPGEFLEICRTYGHKILGIDAPNGTGGMGDSYIEASRLLQERQKIPIEDVGFVPWVCSDNQHLYAKAALINSRGSIEQAFSDYMLGERHDLHHDCRLLSWNLTASLQEVMSITFRQLARLLRPGGCLLINANGSANSDAYCCIVENAATSAGLELVFSEPPLIHKWRRA